MNHRYQTILDERTLEKGDAYRHSLQNGREPGEALRISLGNVDLRTLDTPRFLALLFQTKRPRVFAESEIIGDGTDWTLEELSILGDVSVAVPVRIFDDGRHRNPSVHSTPFKGCLIFTPGALLRNDRGNVPADWPEVVTGGNINAEHFMRLYERRLLPVFQHVQESASHRKRKALITMPGLGCGQFAGMFRGQLGELIADSVADILERYGQHLSNIEMVYFDPYDECENQANRFGDIQFRVRPRTKGDEGRPQLCPPPMYQEVGDDFSDIDLYSIVAWDHVSWPGNDFYAGARATDDGVKAAATDVMAAITGIEGAYDSVSNKYVPPASFATWEAAVHHHKISLGVNAPMRIYSIPGH